MRKFEKTDEYRLPETEELVGEGFVILYTPNGVRADRTKAEIVTLVVGDFDEQYAAYGNHKDELAAVVDEGLAAVRKVFAEFEPTFDSELL